MYLPSAGKMPRERVAKRLKPEFITRSPGRIASLSLNAILTGKIYTVVPSLLPPRCNFLVAGKRTESVLYCIYTYKIHKIYIMEYVSTKLCRTARVTCVDCGKTRRFCFSFSTYFIRHLIPLAKGDRSANSRLPAD